MTVNYKMVFSDIDGTLLNSSHQISETTKQAINRITKQGIPFILVSARAPSAMKEFIQQLDTQFIVSYGGSLILDAEFNPIYSVTLAGDELQKLAKLFVVYPDLSVNYYRYNDWFSNDVANSWTIQESHITQLQPQPIKASFSDVHKVLLIGETREIESLEKQLQIQFPHLYIHRSKANYLEIMNKQASKANAVRFLHQRLGISQNETIAFGDNFNDLDMIEYAGLGVAMANAPIEIQQKSDYVTFSNDEDGIAFALDKFVHFCK